MEMGLLTGKVGMDREFPASDTRRDRPWFQPDKRREVLSALEKIRPIAEDHGATLAQLVVAWISAQPGVTAALVGARNPEQAYANARAGRLKLAADELQTIRETFTPLHLDEAFDPENAKR
jgi:aryl-alcohol dehydrogenase-like predicted oxidoreductase